MRIALFEPVCEHQILKVVTIVQGINLFQTLTICSRLLMSIPILCYTYMAICLYFVAVKCLVCLLISIVCVDRNMIIIYVSTCMILFISFVFSLIRCY